MWMSKITKTAIAVYDPADPWESAIQDAAKQITGNWLPSHPCQMLAKAVASLKIGTRWLDRDDLLPVRAHHLFNPDMISNKDVLVFATHLLYLRDILENGEIDDNLHEPISFMTIPLASFLFRDSPVHLYVNHDLLRASNPDADFLDVGGFLIARNGKVTLTEGVVIDIHYYGDEGKKPEVESLITGMKSELLKAAATEIAPDVFEIGEHFRELRPEMEVWDKLTRRKGEIAVVEPGETGTIYVRYPDAAEVSIPKLKFDEQFVVM
jgi:hypothetical protein